MPLPNVIDTPAAWYGKDLARKPDLWVEALSDREVHELVDAAERYLARTDDIGAMTAADFPLALLGPKLKGLRHTLQHGLGFRLLRGLPVDELSVTTVAAVFCGIGSHLGSPRSQNAKGHILGHVKDVGADINDATTRIYQTTERQTFHTDSCDAVGLLCLKEAMEGGDSLLVSTVTLYNELQKRRPDLVPLMFEPVATDRRGEVPVGEKPYFTIPVLHWHEGYLTGLYHRSYIESARRFEDAPRLTEAHVEALDLFDELASDPDIHLSMRLRPGDMQFVYNHTNLHDRTAFKDWPDPKQRRHLLRLWLSLPDDRPLPDVFKQRYGSIEIGNRGGIITKDTIKLHVPLAP